MNKSIALSLKKDQNLPRDIMLIQQTIIRRCYFIKQANAQNLSLKQKINTKLSSKLDNLDTAPKTN